jgi:hypothetical protein
VDPDDPEIKNSDNTVLFLLSCYQYIMIALILSVGPPYRQRMISNSTFPACFTKVSSLHAHNRHRNCLHNDNNPDSATLPLLHPRIDLYLSNVQSNPHRNRSCKLDHILASREICFHPSSNLFGKSDIML